MTAISEKWPRRVGKLTTGRITTKLNLCIHVLVYLNVRIQKVHRLTPDFFCIAYISSIDNLGNFGFFRTNKEKKFSNHTAAQSYQSYRALT